MVVIPAINCRDVRSAEERLRTILKLGVQWLHLDVADGKFAPIVTWGDPKFIGAFLKNHPSLRAEVHLMVKDPERIFPAWVSEGVSRIIVHSETISDFRVIQALCKKQDVTLMLALRPETPVAEILPYAHEVTHIQVLAVSPGFAGQEFSESVLEKVKFLKKHAPHVTLEVDGGVNGKTITAIKNAGADIAVSASYIFDSWFPKRAYKKLVFLAS